MTFQKMCTCLNISLSEKAYMTYLRFLFKTSINVALRQGTPLSQALEILGLYLPADRHIGACVTHLQI